jgi:hypothetical protein
MSPPRLSSAFGADFGSMLAAVASAADPDTPLVPFWPLVGSAYDGELLVVGRSVNGWVRDWTPRQLADPARRASAVAEMRADAEPADGCRMAWVADLWGARSGYNTARSAFWRVQRRLAVGGPGADGRAWPSALAWTNLYKVSPAAGWNPGADLERAQRPHAVGLLRRELDELAPRRVLALTGGWIGPFADGLGLRAEGRPGLVEAVGTIAGRPCVVAKHPMGKPEGRLADEVAAAFAELGVPLRR